MRAYEIAIQLIMKHPELQYFVGSRSDSLVQAAEKKLGLSFSRTYRRFLREYGAGSFGSVEIYGIVTEDFENPKIPNGVWYTLHERRYSQLPNHFVIIYNDGMGTLFCLDCGPYEPGAIKTFTPGHPHAHQAKELIANDFGTFFLDLIKNELDLSTDKNLLITS